MSLLPMLMREIKLNLRGKMWSLLAALLMTALSFVVFDVFLVVTHNLGRMLQREREAIGIEAFLGEDVDEATARRTADTITRIEGVRSVYYVSPVEAEATFRSELPGQENLLDLLGDRYQLPASLQISLNEDSREPEDVERIARTVTGMDGFIDVVYGERYLSELSGTMGALKRLDLFVGLVLVVSISLLVANTVRMAVFRRVLTVRILSIIGAPGWYLQLPFLVEGFLMGFIGSAAGLVFTAVASAILRPSIPHEFLPGEMVTGVMILGSLIGVAGSWTGLRAAIPGHWKR
ncbi:FtsX-like permease family protein [Candidatus Fermentibacteria bacterium]|nr:FtsX-like permease family protein [Candidatus Fermentibacteria bacterium]